MPVRANKPTAHDRYIGERIREARVAAKLSLEDLADMIGTSYQQVQKYESGKNRVNGARFDRLCTALNRPLTYFFPNATDIRHVPTLSAFLTDRQVQELAKVWHLLAPPDRHLVVTTAKRLARDQA
jgi:transcriptional regulator with XRE-family HTH domain